MGMKQENPAKLNFQIFIPNSYIQMSDYQQHHMLHCISLAAKGRYQARPNPMVGAVIVRDDEVIAEGFHEKAGEAHAEINALSQAGELAQGAELYITMEPCAHHGKTGPCTEAIINAGVAKVFYGMIDPDPKVAGKGVAALQVAGIEVEGPILEKQSRKLNAGFVKRHEQGLPYVKCKLAMSIDGRTAMASGESKWITGRKSRDDVQALRAASSAVVTGVDTILVDNPGLDSRLKNVEYEQPLRVIVDSKLRTPLDAKTLSLPGKVLLATSIANNELLADKAAEFDEAKVMIRSFPGESGQVDLKELLSFLATEMECNDVLLESGASLAGAMLKQGLVDEVITYIAPKILGSEARPLFQLPGLQKMSDHYNLEIIEVSMMGEDCKMRSRVTSTD